MIDVDSTEYLMEWKTRLEGTAAVHREMAAEQRRKAKKHTKKAEDFDIFAGSDENQVKRIDEFLKAREAGSTASYWGKEAVALNKYENRKRV